MHINFKYSHPYEQCLNEKAPAIPRGEILAKISAMDKFWKSRGLEIEKVCKEVTGLSFVRKEIICYLNSGKALSEPLTIKIGEAENMQDALVHELIYALLMDNEIGFTEGWKAMFERFKDETPATKTYTGIYAIHLLVAEKLFPERIENVRSYSKVADYVKSGEIVDRIGANEIVKLIFQSLAF